MHDMHASHVKSSIAFSTRMKKPKQNIYKSKQFSEDIPFGFSNKLISCCCEIDCEPYPKEYNQPLVRSNA